MPADMSTSQQHHAILESIKRRSGGDVLVGVSKRELHEELGFEPWEDLVNQLIDVGYVERWTYGNLRITTLGLLRLE